MSLSPQRVICVLLLLYLILSGLLRTDLHAQTLSVRTNLLYLSTATPNLSVEGRLADRWTLGLSGSYNPFLFPRWEGKEGRVFNPKLIHWTVVPEVKYWFCRSFQRSHIGLHAIYASFNVGGIPFLEPLKETRYTGIAFGGGISYGYEWAIGGRWGLELSAGAGYLRLIYDKCDAYVCGHNQGTYVRDYIGPTKLALTLSYYFL